MRRLIYISLFGGLLAGCGGGGPGGANSPTAGSPGQQNGAASAYRYAACMREHGVPDFPDPKVTSRPGSQSIAIRAVTGNTPADKAALKACSGILPGPQSASQIAQQQHQHLLGLLSFARCMRAHGLSSFPDPDAQGQISREALANAGINIQSPTLLRAAATCVPASEGAVTRAAIASAVNRGR